MNILVFTKNWLGDILFEVPAFQALRENYPEARLVAAAPPRCAEILSRVPLIDEIRPFDERENERSLLAKINFIRWLRKEKFDRVFIFHRSFTRTLLSLLGGVKERIGYDSTKRRFLLTTAVPKPAETVHQVDYFLVVLKWAGLRVKFGSEYQFFYRKEEEREAARLLENSELQEGKFSVFHIGANWIPKRWPAGHFARLAQLLSEEESCPVILTGSSGDEPLAREILQKAGAARMVSFCGKTSLGVLGAVFKKSAFMISADSGPLHIASGVGVPVVALFGPTCPRMTGPRGTGRKIIIQHAPPGYPIPWISGEWPKEGWMENILPENVLLKIRQENLWPWKKEKVSSLSR